MFNRIIKLKDSKNDEKLAEDLQEENCQQIIDFIFKLKDKFPSSSQEKQDELDIFDKIMDFMTENNLMPSKELIEKYKKSKTNSQLDIPDYETLNHHIEMKEEEYELLIENTKNKEEFVYFFDNNNIKIEEQIGKTKEGNKFLVISHCSKNSNEMIGAGLMIYSNGEIYQGYFKANKLHFFGRYVTFNFSTDIIF